MARTLPTNLIPESLLKDGVLYLADFHATAFCDCLNGRSIAALDPGRNCGGAVGGDSKDEAEHHFVCRYTGSSGRVGACVLGPIAELEPFSDYLLASFSDGDISLLDIPSGSGAASCSLLSYIAALRQHRVIPSLPLSVTICAGERSPDASAIHQEMVAALSPFWQSQGIDVTLTCCPWDATDTLSSTQLVDAWFNACPGASEYAMIICGSLSVFASTSADDVHVRFEQIFSRLHDKSKAIVLWVEPDMKSTPSIFASVQKWLSNLKIFGGAGKPPAAMPRGRVRVFNPSSQECHDLSLQVHQFYKV